MMESENLIHTLDQFNTAIFLKDTQGRYLSMNSAGIQLVRKSNADVLGKTAFDLFDTHSATQMMESDHHAMNSKSILTSTYNSQDLTTGKTLHIFTAKKSIISPSGRALGTIGMSIVNYKNSELFSYTCKILPQFVTRKCTHLLSELIEARTMADFLKIHQFQ